MRKYLALSVVASTLLMAGGDIAPVEPVVEAVAEESVGKFSGQFRAFYVDRTYNQGATGNRNALAVGGWVGYETAAWNGLSAGFKAYGVEAIRLHDFSVRSDAPGFLSYDPSLNGRDGENYGFFGEAYLNYATGNTNIKVGRQRLDTPFAGADDARMLPNLFEAAILSNTDIENTTLIAGHVTQMTMGTFSNIYDNNLEFGLQSGYGLGTTLAQSGDFEDMGTVALGAGNDTDGVTVGAVIYKGIDNLTLQLWDYYAHDLMNVVYLQGDYGFDVSALKMTVSGQYINQSDVGDNLAGNALQDITYGNSGSDVDANYYAVKLGASTGALSGYFAYSTTDSDTAGNQGIITPWGGMPAFTQGMVTRHQFFSDTDTWKVAATYKMDELLGANVKASVFYVEFDIGAANSYSPGNAWTATESGFDVQYQATKDLNLRFRGNFPDDFSQTGTGWDEYRLIANYNF